jgi:CHAT domain-containing protein
MKRFYGYLKAGMTKDEALRAAQVDLLRFPGPEGPSGEGSTPGVFHPFHWAAFQLIGDWK